MDADGGRSYAQVLERDVKKWEPVFDPKSRDNKNLERAFDSIKCHPALIRYNAIWISIHRFIASVSVTVI